MDKFTAQNLTFGFFQCICQMIYFITGRAISNRLGVAAPQSRGGKGSVSTVFVEQPLAYPGSANNLRQIDLLKVSSLDFGFSHTFPRKMILPKMLVKLS